MLKQITKRRAMAAVLATAVVSTIGLPAARAGEETTPTTKREASFPAIRAVKVKDFVGVVEIATGDSADATALIQDGKRPYSFDVFSKEGALYVAGDKAVDKEKLYKAMKSYGGADRLAKLLRDYPVVKIIAPKDASVVINDSFTKTRGGDIAGKLIVDGGMVAVEFGNVGAADVSIHGSGKVLVGDVAGALALDIHGSGDFEAVSAKAAKMSVHGSGDISLGRVASDATIEIHGSGDFTTADVGGALKAIIHGSGDVMAGSVKKGLMTKIHGSGDVAVKKIEGSTTAYIYGNGDVRIDEGAIDDLRVEISGSGDFIFDGAAKNMTASVGPSGLVRVAKNSGELNVVGDGDVYVDGEKKSARRRY